MLRAVVLHFCKFAIFITGFSVREFIRIHMFVNGFSGKTLFYNKFSVAFVLFTIRSNSNFSAIKRFPR